MGVKAVGASDAGAAFPAAVERAGDGADLVGGKVVVAVLARFAAVAPAFLEMGAQSVWAWGRAGSEGCAVRHTPARAVCWRGPTLLRANGHAYLGGSATDRSGGSRPIDCR